MIGRELARRGVEVTAVVPRRAGQGAVELLDGIRVLGFEPREPFSAIDLFRQADADVYHSQEPSFGTYLAQRAMPGRKHAVTFRDTRDARDWWIEMIHPSLNYVQVLANLLYEDNFLVHRAVRRADSWLAASRMLIPKARSKYGLSRDPVFMPSPIPLMETIQKSDKPLVCFIARLDRRKRPQIFFDLAAGFPEVQFIAIGAGRDPGWEAKLRSRYAGLPNLEMRGFVDQFVGQDLLNVLNQSWVLVNTSARESLPTTFVEAAGHACAILSGIDPDGFASNFGYHVTDGDYHAGLRYLLENDRWRDLGRSASSYVRKVFTVEAAINEHLDHYVRLLEA
jgi:glycosyltransferase involved in cell wall biosynthesis